jgi:predicted ester cyclase
VIRKFYQILNAKNANKAKSIAKEIFSPDWHSYGNNEEYRSGGGPAFVDMVNGFCKAVPNLTWNIRDIVKSGNRYIVRSEASGTPISDFLGVAPTGKSFKIMTIDIHTVINGKIIKSYHLEDWSSAIRQLSGK